MTPRPWGSERGREMFASQTKPTFDAIGAAESAADQVVGAVLEPQRLARLLDAERRLPGQLSLSRVLDALVAKASAQETKDPRRRSLREAVSRVVASRLMALASNGEVALRIRLRCEEALITLRKRLAGPSPLLALRIERFLERDFGAAPPAPAAQTMPPGSPIGSGPNKLLSHADQGCGFSAH